MSILGWVGSTLAREAGIHAMIEEWERTRKGRAHGQRSGKEFMHSTRCLLLRGLACIPSAGQVLSKGVGILGLGGPYHRLPDPSRLTGPCPRGVDLAQATSRICRLRETRWTGYQSGVRDAVTKLAVSWVSKAGCRHTSVLPSKHPHPTLTGTNDPTVHRDETGMGA